MSMFKEVILIVVLGASGFVGQALLNELRDRGLNCVATGRSDVDYYDVDAVRAFLLEHRASLLINSAGYTGKPNVDACEIHKTECLQGNAVLPGILRAACEDTGTVLGHVSSGCIFAGEKPDGRGFNETDAPNFSFRQNNCSFYSGCKALGEEVLEGMEHAYVWRLRIPFDQHDGGRNYLSKMMRYERLLQARNSLSHLGEFATACVDSWVNQIPYGVYNLTNPGSVTTQEVTELLRRHLVPGKEFKFFEDETEFMSLAATTPRSNCVLDSRKALDAGLKLRPVIAAIEDSLCNWQAPDESPRLKDRT